MATLYLIRHGQASFGKADYDALSPVGWEQGRVLGRSLRERVLPSGLFAGGLRRHRETAQALAEGYADPLPTLQVIEDFNEFDHELMVERLRPEWGDRARMAADLARTAHPAKAFQQVFAQALQRWVCGAFDAEYPETWTAFRTRVVRGVEQAIAQGGGGDVLVATSGGPIAVIVQHLLGLDDARTLDVNEKLANAGVTRVLYSGERRSLQVFNSFAHLEAASPKLVTYR